MLFEIIKVVITLTGGGSVSGTAEPSRNFSLCTSSYVGNFVTASYGGGAEKSAFGGGISSLVDDRNSVPFKFIAVASGSVILTQLVSWVSYEIKQTLTKFLFIIDILMLHYQCWNHIFRYVIIRVDIHITIYYI